MDSKVKDWKTMILVSHDFFHQWRKAVAEKYGEEEANDLILRFWELVGQNTADSYLHKGNIDPDDLAQIVSGVARSSQIMGETVEIREDGDDILLIHTECPWIRSFELNGIPGQCQAGCDQWFKAAVTKINDKIAVTTESSLASGHDSCTRRFSFKNQQAAF